MTAIERVKGFIKQKDKCIQCAMTVVCFFLLVKTFTNLMYNASARYQVFKDFYYYRGVSFFLIVLILLRKVSFLNFPMLATIAVYVIAAVRKFTTVYTVDACGGDYRNALLAKCVVWGLFVIILADIIRTGKRACFNKENKVFAYMAIIAFSVAFAMNLQSAISLFCPVVALYLTPIGKKQWNWFVDCLTIAYYCAFVRVMTKSLIEVPYTKEYLDTHANYYGIFSHPWPEGIFCAGAFACVMYWLVKFWNAEKRELLKLGLCILALGFPVYTTLIAASRSAVIGIIGCALFAFIFAAARSEKAWKRRGIGTLIVITAAGGCGVLLLWFLSRIDPKSIDVNGLLGNQFRRYVSVARRMFMGGAEYYYFPKGSILSVMDELLSNRLSILTETLKNITFLGKEDVHVLVGNISFHPHNTYAAWLMLYGWAGGIFMIIWFFGFLVQAAKGVLKRNQACVFPLLWGALAAFAMLTECLPWMYPAALILFFVQYPLLIEPAEDEQALFCKQPLEGNN